MTWEQKCLYKCSPILQVCRQLNAVKRLYIFCRSRRKHLWVYVTARHGEEYQYQFHGQAIFESEMMANEDFTNANGCNEWFKRCSIVENSNEAKWMYAIRNSYVHFTIKDDNILKDFKLERARWIYADRIWWVKPSRCLSSAGRWGG